MHSIFISFLLQAATHFVQVLIGTGVFTEIENLVAAQVNSGLTGAQKKQAVHDGLAAIGGDAGTAIKNTATWALNLGIETAVAAINVKSGVSFTTTTN
jgi:hypothetical protein